MYLRNKQICLLRRYRYRVPYTHIRYYVYVYLLRYMLLTKSITNGIRLADTGVIVRNHRRAHVLNYCIVT